MDKSFVTLEQHICLVCGQPFDTGALLLDRRLSKRFEHHTATGYGFCPEHEKLRNEGYVALVEIDPAKSTVGNSRVKPEHAYRTGRVAHLRRAAFNQLFSVSHDDQAVVFVEPGVVAKLSEMAESHA